MSVSLVCESKAGFSMSALTKMARWFLIWWPFTSCGGFVSWVFWVMVVGQLIECMWGGARIHAASDHQDDIYIIQYRTWPLLRFLTTAMSFCTTWSATMLTCCPPLTCRGCGWGDRREGRGVESIDRAGATDNRPQKPHTHTHTGQPMTRHCQRDGPCRCR